MNNKEKKLIQKQYANENINFFFSLLENRFKPEYDEKYVKEIKKFSENFNIRLTREQKLKFCKKCNTYLTTQTLKIRLNSQTKTKEYICLKCNNIKKFKY